MTRKQINIVPVPPDVKVYEVIVYYDVEGESMFFETFRIFAFNYEYDEEDRMYNLIPITLRQRWEEDVPRNGLRGIMQEDGSIYSDTSTRYANIEEFKEYTKNVMIKRDRTMKSDNIRVL